MREYALYKGENLLRIGTLEEIAKDENVQVDTVRYYMTNAYKRKINKRNAKDYRVLVSLD